MKKFIQNILSCAIVRQPMKLPLLQTRIAQSFIFFLLFFLCSTLLLAQEASILGDSCLVKSMGLPQIWKPYFSSMVARDRRGVDSKLVGELNLGIYKDLMNPVVAALGFIGEGYVRAGGSKVDGGVRLQGASRFFFIQGGVDYSFRTKDLDFIMSFNHPLRRGGPLGKGGSFRLDWIPSRRNSLSIGLSIPFGQPHMGKSRPNSAHVSLLGSSSSTNSVYAPDIELQKKLNNIRHAANWINRYTTPFLDQSIKKDKSAIVPFVESIKELKSHIRLKDDLYPEGHVFEEEVNFYHREIQKAFSLATKREFLDGGISVTKISMKAREVILCEVIIPYNRLIGQRKKHDSVLGLGRRAEEIMDVWVRNSKDVTAEHRAAVMYVFRQIIRYIDENREISRKFWKDSRLVWIPLHFALRFEDHDTEDEIDAIIEKAVGQQFTDANDVHYVINELFQPELERMIRAAKDYHVLWIHDFRGKNKAGEPDKVAYQLAVKVYLQTLIEKVREYEATKKIPLYMIFLDQNYFEANQSRLWLELLENPLDHQVHLPPKFGEWEEEIRKTQGILRNAVAESPTLQEGLRRYGKEWLANKIKVHINVTNPSDLSFRSSSFFKFFPYVPDNIMRDHRKIIFYDVTELDPGSGEAMYVGAGIGEHYVGPTWDDRGILARGPALLSLKDAARDLLLSQGFEESDIPPPLQRLAKPSNYQEMLEGLRAKGWTALAMQVHNATGFGSKNANIIKAILYNLMPKGSHLYIPDSVWISTFWGSMLVSASLRGCVVLVICPAVENAPSSGQLQMSRANELFSKLLIIQELLGDEIRSVGGLLKTGVYNMNLDVGDIFGKIQKLSEQMAESEVFRKVFPFHPSVVEMIVGMPEILVSDESRSPNFSEYKVMHRPKMHLKSQFFASERTINTLIPMEGWKSLIKKYIIARVKQVSFDESKIDAKDLRKDLKKDAANLLTSWGRGLSSQERGEAIIYLTVGSHNQDYRSMVMDGEDLFVVGRAWAMVAYLDFVSLIGQTTWVENVNELEKLLPKHEGFWKWLGKYLQLAL